MKIFSFLLFVVGICFCIAGFIGHYPAFAGATLSFCNYNDICKPSQN
ncbi:hypothetical protein KK449_19080 [Clostridioides difficile]|nr:hypothetical protein [Clostridioides difficile]MBT2146443.1 hypothetical protein [Clostridioides difficile]MBT2158439.1 hypothetical protein [Clostridioides difficile]MBT2159566.1 hypothetical protein [Clostridioides difficile]